MAQMMLLGVGTALPDADRGYTHMVWDGPGGPLLIDAGGSTYQRLLRVGVNPQALRGVVLTHDHLDHINGLPSLVFSMALAGRTTPLPVYGLEHVLALTRRLLEASEPGELVVPLSWCPIVAGDTIPLDEPWTLRTAMNEHSRPCLALRFENPQTPAALVYSGDTAPCQSVIDLARGADVLIHEATVDEPGKGHSTPREVAEVAQQAGVARVVLVHFSPQWTMPEERALAEMRAAGFGGVAEVGQEFQAVGV